MEGRSPQDDKTIWTIGHSNHPLEEFLNLLQKHRLEVLVDVRSSPYSAYASDFNKEAIEAPLRARGIRYLFLGDLVGGRAEGEQFYDPQGRVLYDRLAESAGFRQGIQRLLGGIENYRVVLMCGEEDPTDCHRRLLIGRVLRGHGVRVLHVRGDGQVQTEDQVAAADWFRKTKGQKSLFDTEDPDEWKSIQSVSPRKPRESSSTSCEGPESSD